MTPNTKLQLGCDHMVKDGGLHLDPSAPVVADFPALAPSINATRTPASTVLVVGGVSVKMPDNVKVGIATPVPDTAMVFVPLA